MKHSLNHLGLFAGFVAVVLAAASIWSSKVVPGCASVTHAVCASAEPAPKVRLMTTAHVSTGSVFNVFGFFKTG